MANFIFAIITFSGLTVLRAWDHTLFGTVEYEKSDVENVLEVFNIVDRMFDHHFCNNYLIFRQVTDEETAGKHVPVHLGEFHRIGRDFDVLIIPENLNVEMAFIASQAKHGTYLTGLYSILITKYLALLHATRFIGGYRSNTIEKKNKIWCKDIAVYLGIFGSMASDEVNSTIERILRTKFPSAVEHFLILSNALKKLQQIVQTHLVYTYGNAIKESNDEVDTYDYRNNEVFEQMSIIDQYFREMMMNTNSDEFRTIDLKVYSESMVYDTSLWSIAKQVHKFMDVNLRHTKCGDAKNIKRSVVTRMLREIFAQKGSEKFKLTETETKSLTNAIENNGRFFVAKPFEDNAQEMEFEDVLFEDLNSRKTDT